MRVSFKSSAEADTEATILPTLLSTLLKRVPKSKSASIPEILNSGKLSVPLMFISNVTSPLKTIFTSFGLYISIGLGVGAVTLASNPLLLMVPDILASLICFAIRLSSNELKSTPTLKESIGFCISLKSTLALNPSGSFILLPSRYKGSLMFRLGVSKLPKSAILFSATPCKLVNKSPKYIFGVMPLRDTLASVLPFVKLK